MNRRTECKELELGDPQFAADSPPAAQPARESSISIPDLDRGWGDFESWSMKTPDPEPYPLLAGCPTGIDYSLLFAFGEQRNRSRRQGADKIQRESSGF